MLASKSGNCAIEVFIRENTPKIAKATKIRAVVTGLFTADLYMLIISVQIWLSDDLHPVSRAEAVLALDDDVFAFAEAFKNLE